jgi:hypothetical protein
MMAHPTQIWRFLKVPTARWERVAPVGVVANKPTRRTALDPIWILVLHQGDMDSLRLSHKRLIQSHR